MSKSIVIAIDGPAGSGKSTAAKFLARELGFLYLDTGAMYRAVTYLALKYNIVEDTNSINDLVNKIFINLKYEDGVTRVFVDDEELTDKIRTFEVNSNVSIIAKIPEVRTALVDMQRKIASNNNLVTEGRDTTTVVFPEADLKIYLIASIAERAKRRLEEFRVKNPDITLAEVQKNLEERDRIDSSRAVSPLKKAEEAIVIDTTNMSIADEIDEVMKRIDLIKSESTI
ncbi:MAG: (d)CMP kinase [Melioribacteraceae bacterium]|nr:(d)CMP kinase [Melioribacteraceae bacterium]